LCSFCSFFWVRIFWLRNFWNQVRMDLLFLLIWITPFLLCKKGRSSTEWRAMRKQE
jgi:hypothetical protein